VFVIPISLIHATAGNSFGLSGIYTWDIGFGAFGVCFLREGGFFLFVSLPETGENAGAGWSIDLERVGYGIQLFNRSTMHRQPLRKSHSPSFFSARGRGDGN